MAPSPFNPEHDIIQARIDVRLAQNRRLVESWPDVQNYLKRVQQSAPPTTSSVASEHEEQEICTPMPEISELAGIGASEPKDGERRREDFTSNEKLRVQLLGKNHAKKQKDRDKHSLGPNPATLAAGSKPRPIPTKRAAESDSDDEGRSSLWKSRQDRKERPYQPVYEPMKETTLKTAQLEQDRINEPLPQRKPGSFLDEVLVTRSLQKRKKSNDRNERGATAKKMEQDG